MIHWQLFHSLLIPEHASAWQREVNQRGQSPEEGGKPRASRQEQLEVPRARLPCAVAPHHWHTALLVCWRENRSMYTLNGRSWLGPLGTVSGKPLQTSRCTAEGAVLSAVFALLASAACVPSEQHLEEPHQIYIWIVYLVMSNQAGFLFASVGLSGWMFQQLCRIERDFAACITHLAVVSAGAGGPRLQPRWHPTFWPAVCPGLFSVREGWGTDGGAIPSQKLEHTAHPPQRRNKTFCSSDALFTSAHLQTFSLSGL